MATRCTATNRDGKPCGATPRPGTTLCAFHTPELIAKRQEWSRKGGKNSAHDARARKAFGNGFGDLQNARALLGDVLAKLMAGDIDPAVATAMATVARAIDALAKTTAAADLEAQLSEMRDQIVVLSDRRSA